MCNLLDFFLRIERFIKLNERKKFIRKLYHIVFESFVIKISNGHITPVAVKERRGATKDSF